MFEMMLFMGAMHLFLNIESFKAGAAHYAIFLFFFNTQRLTPAFPQGHAFEPVFLTSGNSKFIVADENFETTFDERSLVVVYTRGRYTQVARASRNFKLSLLLNFNGKSPKEVTIYYHFNYYL